MSEDNSAWETNQGLIRRRFLRGLEQKAGPNAIRRRQALARSGGLSAFPSTVA